MRTDEILASIEAGARIHRRNHGRDPATMLVHMTAEEWAGYLKSEIRFPKWVLPIVSAEEMGRFLQIATSEIEDAGI